MKGLFLQLGSFVSVLCLTLLMAGCQCGTSCSNGTCTATKIEKCCMDCGGKCQVNPEGCKKCGGTCKTAVPSMDCEDGSCSGAPSSDAAIKMLSLAEFKAVVEDKSAMIFDARTGKWDDGKRVPGAGSLSANNSEAEILQLIPDKSQKIVTYCGSLKCPAGKALASKLVKLGYTNVSDYSGGIKAWREAGYEVVDVK